jgi:hypothetical protein
MAIKQTQVQRLLALSITRLQHWQFLTSTVHPFRFFVFILVFAASPSPSLTVW